jgi:hypothetical protein
MPTASLGQSSGFSFFGGASIMDAGHDRLPLRVLRSER